MMPSMDMSATNQKRISEEDIRKVVNLAKQGYPIEPLFDLPKTHRLHPGYHRSTFYLHLKKYPKLRKELAIAQNNRVEIYQSRALDESKKRLQEAKTAATKVKKARKTLLDDPQNKEAKDTIKHDLWLAKEVGKRSIQYQSILLRIAGQIKTSSNPKPELEPAPAPASNGFASLIKEGGRQPS